MKLKEIEKVADKCAEDVANIDSLEVGDFGDWAGAAVKVYEEAFSEIQGAVEYSVDNSDKYYKFLQFRLSSYEEAILEIDNDMGHFDKADRKRTQAVITELKFLINMYETYVGKL